METFELLHFFADQCERLNIRYMTVGSLATIFYGEPRFTIDIDVVIDLKPPDVAAFCAAFPSPDFYLSKPAVIEAVAKRHQFNIVQPSAGLKIDCILPDGSPHMASEMRRGMLQRTPGGFDAFFASPEDVIIKKMEYYKLGESQKHLRDIGGVLKVHGKELDRSYIERWAAQLELTEIWTAILERAAQP